MTRLRLGLLLVLVGMLVVAAWAVVAPTAAGSHGRPGTAAGTPPSTPAGTPADTVADTPADAPADTPADTVVSFTFDDNWSSQAPAAEVLTEHGMVGTFYVVSSYVDTPDRLSVPELRRMVADGHEIGGHTVTHPALTDLSARQARREVCGGRVALADLGFQVRNFAYPHSDYDRTTERIVRRCGYNSGRQAASLYAGGKSCTACPRTESLRVGRDRWELRTVPSVTRGETARGLEKLVRAAEREGGWLILVFHDFCTTRCSSLAMETDEFSAFVEWMAHRPPTTRVETVGQVVGGPVRPLVGHAPPAERRQHDDGAADLLANPPAFEVMGRGVGQREVVFAGILIALVATVVYRVRSRGRQYQGGGR